jgi:hypothetical protein
MFLNSIIKLYKFQYQNKSLDQIVALIITLDQISS